MSDAAPRDRLISSPQSAFDGLRNVTPETACPYLSGKRARNEVYRTDELEDRFYEQLMARGFRRSGRIVFRPRCRGCCECRQLRVLAGEFIPTRSMRRVLRRNADVRIEQAQAVPNSEKYILYQRYLNGQHDDTMSRSYETFHDFLYNSPMRTFEFQYHLGDRLVGVSIVDRCPEGLSSVYMYFDPDCRSRSLGTFSVATEIMNCAGTGLRYYYLGFYVANSGKMSYKARFRPNQILAGDDSWVTLRD